MRYLTRPVYLTHSCFSKFAESEPDKARVTVSGEPVYSVDAARLSLLSNIRAGLARGFFLKRLGRLSGTEGNEMRQTYITIYELAARLGVPIGLVMEMMERQVIKPRASLHEQRVPVYDETALETARKWLADEAANSQAKSEL